MVSNEDTISKASKGYIEDYYNATRKNTIGADSVNFGTLPVFDRKKALEAVRKDSTVLGALNTLVDRAMSNGFQIEGLDGKSKESTAKRLMEDLRLKKILRQTFFNLFAYGNVFIENVKDGNDSIKELHVLETTHTEPLATKHGEVLGYIQVVTEEDKDKGIPDWKPEEVTHIAVTKLTTNVWGEIDVEAIYSTVLLKQYIMAYLGWLFGTNQLRGFYNIKNANDTQVKGFMSFLKAAQDDITKPVVAEGEVDFQVLREFNEGQTIKELLEYLDNKILALMQVPPIEAGIAGDSNRSNSDAQEQSLLTRVKAVQDVIEEEYAFDLFPKIGFEKVRIKFNPLMKTDVSKLLEQAERMVNMGMKPEVIEDYLESEDFPVNGKLFKTPEEKAAEMETMSPDQPEENTKKSDDMRPSRKRKEDGDGNKRIGTGKAGTTREDQLKRSYDQYPYTYEVRQ